MSNEKAAAAFHGSTCRWGGPQTGACWHVSACGCAVVPALPPHDPDAHTGILGRLLLAVMQPPLRIIRRKR